MVAITLIFFPDSVAFTVSPLYANVKSLAVTRAFSASVTPSWYVSATSFADKVLAVPSYFNVAVLLILLTTFVISLDLIVTAGVVYVNPSKVPVPVISSVRDFPAWFVPGVNALIPVLPVVEVPEEPVTATPDASAGSTPSTNHL